MPLGLVSLKIWIAKLTKQIDLSHATTWMLVGLSKEGGLKSLNGIPLQGRKQALDILVAQKDEPYIRVRESLFSQ